MKMKPEHFREINAAINQVREAFPNAAADYQEAGLTHRRYRWDLLWAARSRGYIGRDFVIEHLYPYLHDDHIDTALRAIVGTEY